MGRLKYALANTPASMKTKTSLQVWTMTTIHPEPPSVPDTLLPARYTYHGTASFLITIELYRLPFFPFLLPEHALGEAHRYAAPSFTHMPPAPVRGIGCRRCRCLCSLYGRTPGSSPPAFNTATHRPASDGRCDVALVDHIPCLRR